MATKNNKDDTTAKHKPKSNKRVRKNVASVDDSANDKKKSLKKASGLINDGKCCRCVFRGAEKTCHNPKSEKSGKYVPRKFGCKNFKRK